MKTANTSVLVLPGLGGSGPDHWQSHWERERADCRRVEQASWDAPELAAWLETLAARVQAAERVVLAAHSLSCALVAHFAARRGNCDGRVVAALLVAPADVDSALCTPPVTRCFAPLPVVRLPFRATVVASRNDPYVAFERAREFAECWGARFVDAGPSGHVNAESQLGCWREGQELLEELLKESA